MAPSLWEAEPQTPVEVQGNVDATGQGLISGLSFDTSRQDFSCFWRNVFIRFIYLEKIIIRAVTKTLHGHPGHFCFRFSGVVVVHLWYHCIIYVYAEVSVLSSSYETFSYVFNLFLKTDKSLCCVHVLIIRICTPQAYLAVYYPSIQCQCDIWDGFNTPPQRYLDRSAVSMYDYAITAKCKYDKNRCLPAEVLCGLAMTLTGLQGSYLWNLLS